MHPTTYSKTSDHIMALIGMDSMAYIRPVTFGALTGFGVFAADGTQLAIFESELSARLTAEENNLKPMRIH